MPEDERQWPIERFVWGLDELKTVLGPEVAPVVDEVKTELIAGMAERDRGDRDAALGCIARAMYSLAGLGDRLGGAEGAMMRAVTAAFIRGLARTDQDAVERNLGIIQAKAGKPKDEE